MRIENKYHISQLQVSGYNNDSKAKSSLLTSSRLLVYLEHIDYSGIHSWWDVTEHIIFK